jgi:hypothetical protein
MSKEMAKQVTSLNSPINEMSAITQAYLRGFDWKRSSAIRNNEKTQPIVNRSQNVKVKR